MPVTFVAEWPTTAFAPSIASSPAYLRRITGPQLTRRPAMIALSCRQRSRKGTHIRRRRKREVARATNGATIARDLVAIARRAFQATLTIRAWAIAA